MEIKNCSRCGKVFTMLSSPICAACEKAEEEDFQKVKEYIHDNPLSSMAQIADETSVSAKRIQRYIKEGRLEISKGVQGSVTCESCGKPIMRGKYCDSCLIRITGQVDEMFGKKSSDNSFRRAGNPKMHSRQKTL